MVDMFLKLGSIEGDSTSDKYKGWINVLTFSWGATNTGSLAYGGGGGTGKAQVQDFSFVKEPDSSTPEFFEAVCKGEHFPTAELRLVKTGETQQEFMKIKFSEVFISSYQSGGSAGMIPAEQVSFSFQKVELSSAAQNADGSVGTWNTHGCDFAAQKAL